MIRSERYADGGCPPRIGADSVLFLAILDNFFCFLEKMTKICQKAENKDGCKLYHRNPTTNIQKVLKS